MVLPKTLDYTPVSTTQILANIRAPSTCPLRVDFGGGEPPLAQHSCCCHIIDIVSLAILGLAYKAF